MLIRIIYLVLAMLLLVACSDGDDDRTVGATVPLDIITSTQTPIPAGLSSEGGAMMSFTLSSSAFLYGGPIPPNYSCDGEDISPPLEWSNVPQGTKSFALICDDPDAPVGTWVHWVFYNLPADISSMSENASASLPGDTVHGKNSWGRSDYGGPCPPGGTHRYYFKLYALDKLLDLKAGASKEQLLQAIEGHILDQAETMGVYSR